MSLFNLQSIKALPHHEKDEICTSRAKYRDGRRDTAVLLSLVFVFLGIKKVSGFVYQDNFLTLDRKNTIFPPLHIKLGLTKQVYQVYTINQESAYLLIQGVPAVGAQNELQALCEQYGEIDHMQALDEYPCEEFTEVYVVKYHWFSAARTAKKHLDDKSFFGGTLHVCYAPEFETVSDTRQKLQERRKYIAWKTKSVPEAGSTDGQYKMLGSQTEVNQSSSVSLKRKGENQTRTDVTSCEPVTYIWAGKEYTVYPQSSGSSGTEQYTDSSLGSSSNAVPTKSTSQPFLPRQLCTGTQKTSEVVNRNFTQSVFGNSDKPDNVAPLPAFSSSVNPSKVEDCYSSSAENIKNKLLRVAVPNMKVSFKRRKRI